MLCFDDESYQIIQRNTDLSWVQPLSIADVPGIKRFERRPIAQFAFASKPFLFKWVFAHEGVEKAIYIDSDTWFVSNSSFLFDYLDQYDVLLVPYVVNPGATANEWELVSRNAQTTGYYNAGFIGCSHRADKFLDWWANRCIHGTYTDFYQDIHGDQKYLNWLPSLFSKVFVLRHHGLNVKHFTARYASFKRQPDGLITLDGDPVVYFHFSQNLGNLLHWTPEFYPEVSRYLEELEAARIASGKPYVDMSWRDNKDLARPLLPQSGFEAGLLQAYRTAKQYGISTKSKLAMLIARGGRILPISLRRRRVGKYLRKWWKLYGDATVDTFDALYSRLSRGQREQLFVFGGVSGLAFYLAYLGHKVVIYDPFQGYYNPELDTLFNPQFGRAKALCDFWGISSNLTICRVFFTEVRELPDFKICFVAARLGVQRISEIARELAQTPTLAGCVLLFDRSWPEAYREQCCDTVMQVFPKGVITPERVGEADFFWVNWTV